MRLDHDETAYIPITYEKAPLKDMKDIAFTFFVLAHNKMSCLCCARSILGKHQDI